jgi:hypothetical protein
VDKYLSLYAEPETGGLEGLPEREPWANVVVIPACNESASFLRPPPASSGRSLMVLVINEPLTASYRVSSANQALADELFSRFDLLWQPAAGLSGQNLSLLRDPEWPQDILLVDRYSEGRQVPGKGGVGLARKIGADLATCLIHKERIDSSWIHCTDADVKLPDTYFTSARQVKNTPDGPAALVYPYHHCDRPAHAESREVVQATQLYELSLRYYVAGMKFAGSPYAFHTIGSTMAVNALHYAKVRGFPKREAGEDFYLLNKLAKVGSVLELDSCKDCLPIEIESRRSDRVPFGTGAAVGKMMNLGDPVADYRFYDPAVFELLGAWLQSLPVIWHSKSSDVTSNILAERAGHDKNTQLQVLQTSLEKIKTEQALEHAFRQSRTLEQFTRHMHTWFDAFRTLKLIHILRDSYLPSIDYASLGANRVFRRLLEHSPDLLSFYEQLHRKLSK